MKKLLTFLTIIFLTISFSFSQDVITREKTNIMFSGYFNKIEREEVLSDIPIDINFSWEISWGINKHECRFEVKNIIIRSESGGRQLFSRDEKYVIIEDNVTNIYNYYFESSINIDGNREKVFVFLYFNYMRWGYGDFRAMIYYPEREVDDKTPIDYFIYKFN